MAGNPHLCKTIVRCRSCDHEELICLRLRRGIPEVLQCDHVHGGGGAGGGGLCCRRCGSRWLDLANLVAIVEDLLPRRTPEWRRIGAVVVTC